MQTRGFILLSALAVLACRVDIDPAGKACDETHGCQTGERCFEGVCVIPCDEQLGQSCTVGVGACAQAGIYRCDGNTLSCDAVAGTPEAELCDGVDNDCNGTPDDDLTPPACALSQGVCAQASVTCEGAAGWTSCEYGPDYEETEASCDRLDNDCDGTPDDVSGCVYTLVGHDGAPGRRDGPAASAQFSFPKFLAADSAGNLYLADEGNHQLRRIAVDGTVTTLAGDGRCGEADGPVATAELCGPFGIAVSPDAGTIYFTEVEGDRVRKLENGQVITVAGSGTQGFADGDAATARFNEPYSVAPLPNGDLLIADGHNHRIRKYIASSQQVITVAGTGSSDFADGTPLTMQLPHPDDVVVDPLNGDLYVSEEIGSRVRVIPADGGVSWTLAGATDGEREYAEGVGTAARFNEVYQMALDPVGRRLFVTDRANSVIRSISLEDGTTRLIAGWNWGFRNGVGDEAFFRSPWGIVFTQGALFVSDDNHVIRRLDPETGEVTDFAGLAAADRVRDGPAATAQTGYPWGLTQGPDGAIYWIDSQANAIRVLRDGEVSTLVGNLAEPRWGHVDGALSLAEIDEPTDLAFGPTGLLYLTEDGNDGVRVIDLGAGQMSTLAGPLDGEDGWVDGAASIARFSTPSYLTASPDGGLYLSDLDNSLVRRVETPSGVTSTVAGTHDIYTQADGPVGTGSFDELRAVAVGPDGTVYAGDFQSLRSFPPGGAMTTLISDLPWQVTELQTDGNALVYSISGSLYRLSLANPGFPVTIIDPYYGFEDGVINQSAANPASIGFIEGLVVTPQYYLFTDGDGHRLRRLWR